MRDENLALDRHRFVQFQQAILPDAPDVMARRILEADRRNIAIRRRKQFGRFHSSRQLLRGPPEFVKLCAQREWLFQKSRCA